MISNVLLTTTGCELVAEQHARRWLRRDVSIGPRNASENGLAGSTSICIKVLSDTKEIQTLIISNAK